MLKQSDGRLLELCSLGFINVRDHFHKWLPLLHSFVFMLIRPTTIILKQIFL